MKAVKATGLVPVKMGRRVFGLPPKEAAAGVKSGGMEFFQIPEGIETIDVAGFEIVAAPKAEPLISTDGLVEIPDDWRIAHGTKRAMIAKAILGLEPKAKLPVPEGQDVAEFAVSVIEQELAKRAPPDVDPPVSTPPGTNPIPETPAQPDA